jgi:MFS family permease
VNLRPQSHLSEAETRKGLKMVIGDGLAAEAMTTLTGGAFLVAMALLMGANNFQIGLLAAMPTFTNLFQLISIWLVRRFNNRRAIVVICSFLARFPLLIIGIIPFVSSVSINLLISCLFFYYFFGSIAGPSWNAWMKDLVPENELGAYFSKRGRLMQILNVVLGIAAALVVDYVKKYKPDLQLSTYGIMFATAGFFGVLGAFILSKAPEPQSFLEKGNIFKMLKRPLNNRNFLRLLIFNSAWAFAINLATPFFVVYLMKDFNYPVSYIIILSIIGQLCSIFTMRLWGNYADRFSNKSVIGVCAPVYIFCIMAWCFVGIYSSLYSNLILLVLIYITTGISTAGIDLSLTNIGLKLAPKEESIIYLSTKSIITAFFSTIAPLLAGIMADFFTTRKLNITAQWNSPKLIKIFRLVQLHDFNFLFLMGAVLAFLALQFLYFIKEQGEVEKDEVRRVMRAGIQRELRDYFLIGDLIGLNEKLWAGIKRKMAFDDNEEKK